MTTTRLRPALAAPRQPPGACTALDSALFEGVDDPRIDLLRPRGVTRRPWLELAVRDDERCQPGIGEEHGDRRVRVGGWGGQHRLLRVLWSQTEHMFESNIAQVFESS